jgi:hypothetical protein
MPTLKDALEGEPPDLRDEFYKRMRTLASASATNRQAFLNLEMESRLTATAWLDLINAVLTGDPSPLEIQKRVIQTCRLHVLSGPEATASSLVFGRAVTRDRFCELMVDLGVHPTLDAARRELRRVKRLMPHQLRIRWRNRVLGRYVIWSTFSLSASDPFDGIKGSSDRFRCLLGLDKNEQGMSLLLLRYSLPASLRPLYPTIAEAYSGTQWLYYFRPAPPAESHGWTLTWDECSDESGRPEVVHPAITGIELTEIPEIVS